MKNQCNIPLEWSDGCESQHEGVHSFKQMFADACGTNIQITTAFFGPEHGKGESYGETGVVKTKLQNYILGSGGIIKSTDSIKRFGDAFLSEAGKKFKDLGKSIRTQISF